MDNGKLSRVCRPQRISESSKVSVCDQITEHTVRLAYKLQSRREQYSLTLAEAGQCFISRVTVNMTTELQGIVQGFIINTN